MARASVQLEGLHFCADNGVRNDDGELVKLDRAL
jgi:hypothetical protein